MKRVRRHRQFVALLMTGLLLFWQVSPPLLAATVYWDLDGNVAGAGGASPGGTWDLANPFWSTQSDGGAATAAWIAGDTAVFAAGTNATGSYTVTVAGTQSIGGLRFEEGTVTLSGGTLSLARSSDLFVESGRSATISSAFESSLTGSVTLTKSGAGILTLAGTNSGSAFATTVTGGMLSIATNSNLGSGRLTLDGGILQATGTSTITNGITLGAAGGTINVDGSQTLTVGTTLIAGPGALAKTGLGTLTLSVASTYSGATVVSQGKLTAASFIPARSAVSVASGATIDFLNASGVMGSLSGAGTVAVTGASATRTLTIGGDYTSTTFSGVLQAPSTASRLAVTKVGAGTLTLQLSAASGYTGATTINAGTLALDFSAGSLNSMLAATPVTLGGGTLQVTGRSGSSTVSQTVGALTVGASGGRIVMVLNGATATNLTTGAVTLGTAGGTLLIQSPSGTTVKLGSPFDTDASISGRLIFTNGTSGYDWAVNTGVGTATTAYGGYTALSTTNGVDTANSSLTGSATLTGVRTTSTLKITTSGSGQALNLDTFGLALTGGGLLFTGADDYSITGTTGTLQSNMATAGDLVIHQYGTGKLTIGAIIKDGTTGATALTKSGTGSLVLTGVNTFTGGIFLNEGTLSISNNNQLGTAAAATAITIRDGATFQTAADVSIPGTGASSHTFTLGGGNAKFDVAAGTTLIVGGVVSGAGGLSLTNTGTLQLTGAATFTGPAFVGAGAILKGGVTAFINSASGAGLTVDSGGLVDMNDFTLTVGSISGAGTITNSSTAAKVLTAGGNHLSTTFSGLLSGALSLTKSGAGMLTLTTANTYTGTTTVNGASGVLTVSGAGTLGSSSSPLTVTAGTLDLNGTNQNVGTLSGAAAGIVRNGATGTLSTFSVGNGAPSSASGAYAGLIEDGAGTIALVKNGAGVTTLTGANTYTGGTQVNEGVFVYGNTSAQPGTGITEVAATASLGLGIGGAGFYSLANLDALLNNTLPGVNMAAGAGVGIDTTAGDLDYTAVWSATRGLVKLGTGVLTLSGTNTNTGGITIAAGTLSISSDANLGASSANLTMVGGTLRVTGTSNQILNRTLSVQGTSTFEVMERTNTYTINSPAFSAGGAIVKTGAGTLRFANDINLNGNTLTVTNGTLLVTSAITGAAVNSYTIGNTVLAAGNGGGAMVLSGTGSLTFTAVDVSDVIRIGSIAGGFGSLTVGNGATITSPRWRLGFAGTGVATVLSGATVTLTNYNIGGNGATGVGSLNIAGGTVNGAMISGNGAWSSGRYEQNIGVDLGGGNAGGILDMSAGTANFGIVQNNGAGVGIVNLITGGTLKIKGSVTPVAITTGRAELNFHGGTLEYAGTAANTNFISTGVTAVNIFSEGATINSGGQNLTVAAPLIAPAGNGVASISASGSGYFTAPYVQITGGGGNNDATAVAQIDASGNITGIIITNPGTGYTSAPTVTLVGGTNETVGTATAALNAGNISGGLTKIGNGTLILTGVNTYKGATIVNGGTLSILPTAIQSSSGILVGQTGSGILDLNADGVGAAWNLAAGVGITLGGATTSGSLGFQLGAVSDRIVFNGGSLTVNAGGGYINAVALSGFGIGSYQVISGVTIGGVGTLHLGNLPSGYTYSLSQTASSVTLNVLGLAPAGDLYWTGTVNNSWGGLNGTNSNWATVPNGTTDAGYAPGASNTVYFSATNAAASAFTTTLDSPTSIQGLRILNSGTGAVTIAPGISGSLTIGAGGIIVQAGAPATTTITAPVTFGAAQTLSVVDAGSVLTISGAVSGGPGNSNQTTTLASNVFLTITGAGSVGFGSTANTFTGDILVNGGGFNVDNDRDWGVATVASATSHTIILDNGGRLNVSGAVNPGALTSTNYNLVKIGDGGGIIDVAAGASLSLDDPGQLYGNGALTKTGLGTFTLRIQPTFGGALTIAAGLLRMTGTTAFGLNTAGTTIMSGAALDLNDQAVTDTEPLTISGTGLASAPAGVITNSAGSASFAGPIILAADSTIGLTSTGTVALSGGLSGGFNLTNAGTGTASMTISGIIAAGVGNIIQNSTTSTLVLSGANAAYTSGVIIRQGSVTAATSASALGTATVILGDSAPNANNATLNANLSGTYANNIFLASGTTGLLTINSPNTSAAQVMSGSITGNNNLVIGQSGGGTLTFSGSINHNGTLTANGTGTSSVIISGIIGTNVTSVTQSGVSPLTLSGNNLYIGLTTVNSGSILNIGSGSTAGSILGDVLNNGTLNFNRSNAYTYAGSISGGGAVTKAGAGTVTLSGTNTYSGITTISGGALAGNISSNNLVLNGGVFETSGSFIRSLGTGSGQVQWAAGANGGFSAQGGPLTVTLSGAPSTLAWDSTTNFVSGAGQLLFGSITADNAVTFTHDINLNDPASAVTRTVQVLDNTSSTTDKAVLSGIVSGGANAMLAKTGAGVLELTGANTYSGSTLVSAGTLIVSSIGGTGTVSSSIGAGNATISIGSATTTAGTLTYTGTGETTDRAVILSATTTGAAAINSSGTGALTWQGSVTSAGTTKTFTLGGSYAGSANLFSGTINLGTGNLAKADAGNWELTAANTFVNTTISGGTLKLSGAGTLGSGTLTLGGTAVLAPSLDIGSGRTVTPAAITYTGTTGGAATISGAGTLDLGSAGITVTVADNTANAVDMYWQMNTVTGSGTFVKAGAGTLDISGIASNLFTGSFQVTAGAILGLSDGTNLILNGGVYEGNGSFTRSLGTTGNTVQWAMGANGGFAANGAPLTVTINNSATPALVWDSTPQFVSGAGQLLFGSASANNVATFTNDINLNNAVRTVQVVDNTITATDKAVLSGVLSNGGLTKTGNGVLQLSGTNTFAGALTVGGGTLQFSQMSNLGTDTSAVLMTNATSVLSFVGSTNTVFTRGITFSAAGVIEASGTSGSMITFSGPILATNNQITLRGSGQGVITSGIVETGATAEVFIESGTWTLSGTKSLMADDMWVRGSTSVLNLNSTSVLGNNGEDDSSGLGAGEGGVINLNANNALDPTNWSWLRLGLSDAGGNTVGYSVTPGTGTLNTNGFNLSIGGASFVLGGQDAAYVGIITGNGTLTINGAIALFSGEIDANMAGSGAATKAGDGTVILRGDNTGRTGATTVSNGMLKLDYATNTARKLSSTGSFTMNGGTLLLAGNATQAITESLGGAGLILTAGGSDIVLQHAGTQALTLNIGAINRAAGSGVNFSLSSSSVVATSTASLFGWATYGGTRFATIVGGQIAPLASTAKSDVATWATGDNVTSTTGFSGTVDTVAINSLVLESASASSLTIGTGKVLTFASGGILMTESSGPVAISGGRLASGLVLSAGGELVIHQHSTTNDLSIDSSITGLQAITKLGAGTLVLTGSNNGAGRPVYVSEGTVRATGGNAIGDLATVAMSLYPDAVFDMSNTTERVGGLTGGSAAVAGSRVLLGSTGRIIADMRADNTFIGTLSGGDDSVFVKMGTGLFVTNSLLTEFTGRVIVNQGGIRLDGNTSGVDVFSTASAITINGAGSYVITDQDSSSSMNLISNTAVVTLANTSTATGVQGLALVVTSDGSRADTVGQTNLLAGQNSIYTNTSTGTNAARVGTLTLTSLTRQNRATLQLVGQNLGAATGPAGRIVVTGATTANLGGIGGGGAADLPTISIVPYMTAVTAATGTAELTLYTLSGNSFVTYGANGLRALSFTTEYEQLVAAGGITLGNNVRYSGSTDLTLNGVNKTMNALLVENTSTTAALSLAGGGGALNVASGAFLFTGSATPQGITLSGFSGITTSLSTEYILHVMNTAAAGVTIASPFTTAGAALTKSGLGTLILTSTGSTYTGPTTVNLGALHIDALDKLGNGGSGGLVLNGGTLRFGAVFDPSAIPLTLGISATTDVATTVGGTFDTNGLDITLANSIGQGGNGGLTKIGTGNLTLNAAATYTGTTTVNAGTLTFGVAQAVAAVSDLVLGGGTLDNGSFATTMGRFYLSVNGTILNGGGLTFTGSAEINGSAARTLTLNHTSGVVTFNGELFVLVDRGATARILTITGTGDVTINSQIVDGTFTGSLTKTGNNTLTLTGNNTYSGTTTVSAGTLVVGSDTAVGTGTLLLNNATVSTVGGDRTLANAVQQSSNTTTTFAGTNSLSFSNTYALLAAGNNSTLINNISGAGKALNLGNVTANALTAARAWTISGSGDTYINGSITSSTAFLLNLLYTGTGSLNLGGATTALGTTTIGSTSVNAGTVRVLTGSSINPTASLTILSGMLDLQNGTQTIGALAMGNGPVGSTSGITLNAGSLNLSTDVTYTASTTSGTASISGGTVNLLADRTFTINDSTASTQEMVLDAVLANGDATARAFIKAGTGALVFNNANTYTGTTSINAGTLKFGVSQNMTAGLQFGSTSAITTAGALDLSDASAVFPTLLVQTNSATNVNNLIVGSGQSLTINGNVNIGSPTSTSTTLFTGTGGGSLIVANPAASGVFQIGGALPSSGGNRTLADLSGLGELSVALNTTTGTFRVNPSGGGNQSGRYSTLILPSTGLGKTTVTANLLAIGDGVQNNGAEVNALLLGSGANLFQVNTIIIGTGTRDSGSVSFNSATGTLVIRNAAGSGRAAFNMGTTGGGTGALGANSFDVRGHAADLLLGAVNIGTQNRLNTYTNTFSFDQGTLDMTSLTMSARTGGSGSTGIGAPRDIISTMNLGGGTVVFQNGILNMASVSGTYNTADNLAPVVTANLNISGGNVTIGVVGTVGANAVTMATASASSDIGVPQAVANINITGGTTTVNGNIVRGNVSGNSTATATVTLNGGTLNMTGKAIGSATNTVSLDARQGTLQNLGQLNGGDTLTKTTAGLLVMQGTNTYTGTTQVNGGIVQVGVAGVGSVAAPVSVAGSATLAGSGSIGGSTVIGAGAVLQPGDVTTPGTATSTITGNQTLTFTAANTALTVQDGAQIRLGVSSPTLDIGGSVSFSGGQFHFNGNNYGTASELFNAEAGALAAWNVNPTSSANHDMIKLTNGTLSIGDRAGSAWGEGSVVVDGTLGTIQVGQVFNLIDWSGLTSIDGNFDVGASTRYDATSNVIAGDLDLMALGAGLAWDVSAFKQYGIIVVVPEPSRVLMIMFGLVGLLLRRRRRSQVCG